MQMESGAGIMGKLEGEKAQLRDAMGDLKAKIAALEAQVYFRKNLHIYK